MDADVWNINEGCSRSGVVSITERVYSLAAHAKVYGMVRILDFGEILKFQANSRRDMKYSILVKGETSDEMEQINVRDGKVSIKKVSDAPSLHAHVMSRRDIGEILFRRRDTDNLITEAFGIPSINGAISLLLPEHPELEFIAQFPFSFKFGILIPGSMSFYCKQPFV